MFLGHSVVILLAARINICDIHSAVLTALSARIVVIQPTEELHGSSHNLSSATTHRINTREAGLTAARSTSRKTLPGKKTQPSPARARICNPPELDRHNKPTPTDAALGRRQAQRYG